MIVYRDMSNKIWRILYEVEDKVMIEKGLFKGRMFVVIEVTPDGMVTLGPTRGGGVLRGSHKAVFKSSDPITL